MSILGHENRKTGFDIIQHILERWSPRAMTGEEMPDEALSAVFEAARFAPSSYNEQPWRFIYARNGKEDFDKFQDILTPQNWSWAHNASILMIAASKESFTMNDSPNTVFQFDAGCAWGYMALEAIKRGWVTHGMAGFSREKASELLEIPKGFLPIAAIAIGKLAPKDTLPENMRKIEAPAPRKPVAEFAFEGKFKL